MLALLMMYHHRLDFFQFNIGECTKDVFFFIIPHNAFYLFSISPPPHLSHPLGPVP
jgi:hypothetical protein